MTMSLDNSLMLAKVVFVPHKFNTQEAVFIELQTNNTRQLKLTESHLLLIQKQCHLDLALPLSSFVLTRADHVALNDCVLTTTGPQLITSIQTTVKNGVYTVVKDNPSGLVIVDGIVASSFSDFHFLANEFYQLHRLAHRVSAWFNAVVDMTVLQEVNIVFGDIMLKVLHYI